MSYRLAVGTVDGENITEHFGRGRKFRIYEINQDTDEQKALLDIDVKAQEEGHDQELLLQKVQAFLDWNVSVVLVRQIGPKAERIVRKNGIEVLTASGTIEEVLPKVKKYYKTALIKVVDK